MTCRSTKFDKRCNTINYTPVSRNAAGVTHPRRVGVARPPCLDDVHFFVDEDLSGLGLGLMCLRNDVVVGGMEPIRELVPRLHRDWIPVVAARRWVVISGPPQPSKV